LKTSLIISVYKNVTDLRVVLDSLKFQTANDFEIVVSEDGEFDGMRHFLSSYASPFKIIHLTQPDVGWRKNQALNNAIRKSSGDYLIFIDGDCVLHPKFVESHVKYASTKHVVAGKRVKLGPFFSDMFRRDPDMAKTFDGTLLSNLRALKKDNVKFLEEAFYINPRGPFGFIPAMRRMNQLKGCNMSFHRASIEKINGFDEDYTLPAIGEDIDLTWRFRRAGFNLFSARNRAVQYHLYHKENWVDQSHNEKMMNEKIARDFYVCRNGLVKING
jgi:GT2 family glycosyltransferase